MTQDTLLYLDIEIQDYVLELKELTRTIKQVDDAYIQEPTEENHLFLSETIDRYKSVVNKTRILLECFFEEERKLDLPADFIYRRLYRKLGEAY